MKREKHGLAATGGARTPQTSPHAVCSYPTTYRKQHVCPAQMMKADSMDVLAEERDREVRNILTSIADLAQIMKDLSTLVIDQGTVLDRIDYNMEQARQFCSCPPVTLTLNLVPSRTVPISY